MKCPDCGSEDMMLYYLSITSGEFRTYICNGCGVTVKIEEVSDK